MIHVAARQAAQKHSVLVLLNTASKPVQDHASVEFAHLNIGNAQAAWNSV